MKKRICDLIEKEHQNIVEYTISRAKQCQDCFYNNQICGALCFDSCDELLIRKSEIELMPEHVETPPERHPLNFNLTKEEFECAKIGIKFDPYSEIGQEWELLNWIQRIDKWIAHFKLSTYTVEIIVDTNDRKLYNEEKELISILKAEYIYG